MPKEGKRKKRGGERRCVVKKEGDKGGERGSKGEKTNGEIEIRRDKKEWSKYKVMQRGMRGKETNKKRRKNRVLIWKCRKH